MPDPTPEPLRLTASELAELPLTERLAACQAFVERATALIEHTGQRSIEASDEAGLVTVRISAAGGVEELRLARAAGQAGAAELSTAVVAAVGTARSRLTAEVTGALDGIQVDLDGWPEESPTGAARPGEAAAELRRAREELAGAVFPSSSPGDEARAVSDVDGELRSLRLAPLAVRQTDRHTLGELILTCVRQAQADAAAALAAATGPTGGTSGRPDPQELVRDDLHREIGPLPGQ